MECNGHFDRLNGFETGGCIGSNASSSQSNMIESVETTVSKTEIQDGDDKKNGESIKQSQIMK